jgi:hypothetical protein
MSDASFEIVDASVPTTESGEPLEPQNLGLSDP